MASREYDVIQFFTVYIAIVNGAEGAGTLLSFGPSKYQPRLFPQYLLTTPDMAQAAAAANRILSSESAK